MQNKITIDDFKVIVKILKAAYPRDNFIPNDYTFSLWYKALQDIQYPTLNKAATNYIMTNKFPPTIADIRSLSYSGIDISTPRSKYILEDAALKVNKTGTSIFFWLNLKFVGTSLT